jgi:hypothetical protein
MIKMRDLSNNKKKDIDRKNILLHKMDTTHYKKTMETKNPLIVSKEMRE